MEWFLYDRDLRHERVKRPIAQKMIIRIYVFEHFVRF